MTDFIPSSKANPTEEAQKNIIIRLRKLNYGHWFMPMLKQVFNEHGLELKRTGEWKYISGCATIRIIGQDNFREKYRGICGIVVNLDD